MIRTVQTIVWIFPRERFLVVQSEKMYARPRDIYREVLTFLELPKWDPGAFVNGKEREYAKMPPEIHAALSEFYQPHNKALSDLLRAEIDWD